MSKVKAEKGSKPSKSADILTKAKSAGVTKPAKTEKAKSKEIAKVVAKKDKKSKKVKEPTPEPESDSSDTSASDTEDSESEAEAKPAVNGKANGVKKAAAKAADSSSESESDSDSGSSDSDSESEEEAPKTNGAAAAKAKAAPAPKSDSESDSDSDASSESESDEEKPTAKSAVMGAKLATTAAESSGESSSDESDSDSEPHVVLKEGAKVAEASDSSEGDSDDSDDSESEVEEEKPKPNKRKAEDDAPAAAKKVKTADGEKEGTKNLFVGNLSWNVTEDWLREEFETFGTVEGCRIMTDRATNRSKGFGYVEFSTVEEATAALEGKNGVDLDGRALNVDFSNPRPSNDQRQENRRKQYSDQLSEPSDTLFVGNLSFDAGQDAVTQAFEEHAQPTSVRLPTDIETGNYKGFGYVTFGSVDEAKTALEAMQGAYIEGRPIRLDFSQPRPQNNGSPRGGRGGFGGRGGRGDFGGRGRGGRGGRGGFGDRGGRGGPRGGRGGSTNRGGFGDFSGKKTTF